MTGKTTDERRQESVTKFRDKQYQKSLVPAEKEGDNPIKSNYAKRIPQQTSRESRIKSKLSSVKFSLELDAIQDGEYFCQGCGESHPGLDKSHILSVGQFKALELIKENMQLMCRKCHKIWESGTIEEQMALKCFAANVAFIYRYSQESFNKFLTRIEGVVLFLLEEQDTDKVLKINMLLDTISNIIENY